MESRWKCDLGCSLDSCLKSEIDTLQEGSKFDDAVVAEALIGLILLVADSPIADVVRASKTETRGKSHPIFRSVGIFTDVLHPFKSKCSKSLVVPQVGIIFIFLAIGMLVVVMIFVGKMLKKA